MNDRLSKDSSAPFFSIIIPSYNNGSYLQKCIQSLQKQSFEAWEAIIVIDASPDDAFHIAKQLSDKDGRIQIINKTQNEGTHLARKSGVKRAQGEYALFLDADDELADNALSSLAALTSQQTFDVLHFGTELFGENMPETVCSNLAIGICPHYMVRKSLSPLSLIPKRIVKTGVSCNVCIVPNF